MLRKAQSMADKLAVRAEAMFGKCDDIVFLGGLAGLEAGPIAAPLDCLCFGYWCDSVNIWVIF